MNSMKIRLILMGCILTALSAVLMVTRGFSEAFVGILAVGIVLAAVGVVWNPKKKSAIPS